MSQWFTGIKEHYWTKQVNVPPSEKVKQTTTNNNTRQDSLTQSDYSDNNQKERASIIFLLGSNLENISKSLNLLIFLCLNGLLGALSDAVILLLSRRYFKYTSFFHDIKCNFF